MMLRTQGLVWAVVCAVTKAVQPSAPSPIPAPLRELPWGQLNFLHTTDTHGWHAGHLQEAQYSADWGDYISFASHLRQRADRDGSDLLLIDTGDRVEGNGLYDASTPTGRYTTEIIKHQHIDVITCGNHELYQYNTSAREFRESVRNFKDSYIASNIDYIDPETGVHRPLAARYRRFTTKNQKVRVLAFGFLFNFHKNAKNTVVQDVKNTVKEQWFQDAIREKDVDLYLVAGHVPVRDSLEIEAIYHAIRQVQWDTPIAFFGGHTHIRDYRKFERNAWALESGRYMETIGFMSISGLTSNAKTTATSIDFGRRYIDNNLFSLQHHANRTHKDFDTKEGQAVSAMINEARQALKLDHSFGCSPEDYWLSRAPYPSNSSLVTLVETQILPSAFAVSNRPTMVISNTGALRFDIFKGPFTVDSTFLVSPFTSAFHVIKDVRYKTAQRVLRLLNEEGQILQEYAKSISISSNAPFPAYAALRPALPPQRSSQSQSSFSHASGSGAQIVISASGLRKGLIPGYTTVDDAGADGDDTIHQRVEFYELPNCIAANIKIEGDPLPESVDLAYNEFIEDWILLALRYLGEPREKQDVKVALEGKSMTTLLSEWIHKYWPCPS